MDGIERFAKEADAFREWALRGADAGEQAARNALIRVSRLYLAGLELPPERPGGATDDRIAERVGDDERQAVAIACRRLPLELYWEVFDPLSTPSEAPVCGSVTDDVADIYGEVVPGLREYEAGRRAQAVWGWRFGLRHHWGEHATSAIRALHCWLAANAPERLAADADRDDADPGAGNQRTG
jgi:hypothetical protein